MILLSRRKHAAFLIGIVLLQACLCTVNAAPWRRRKLPRKLHQLRTSKSNMHHAARASETPDEKTLYDSILKQVPGNVVELGLILAKMLFSPFTWQKDLCKDIWEKQGRRRTPMRGRKAGATYNLTEEQLNKLFSLLKTFPSSLVELSKVVLLMTSNPVNWKKSYCEKAD